MLRIIDGKRYNTETAQEVLALDNGAFNSRSDFRFEETSLYLTPKGAWFLAGHGHAMSRWARKVGTNGYGPGEGIQPIDPAKAQSILEDHGQTELVEKHFPDKLSDA